MKGKKLAAVTAVLYILFLAACSASWLAHVPFHNLFAGLTKTVVLENGVFKKNSQSITVVLHDGETAKLEEFSALVSADFRGSSCTEEILQWSQAHPQVSVLYDVVLPNGLTVDNKAQALDFTGIDSGSLLQYSQLLPHFSQAQTVTLGSAEGSPQALSADELFSLVSAHPELNFNYSFTLAGNVVNLSDESIDLVHLDSSMFHDTLSYLACMNKLRTINLGDDVSCTLSWDEIAQLQGACPQASIDYSFELYDKSFTLDAETIDLSHVPVGDKGESLTAALRCMKNCRTLDMDSCGLSNEEMLAIRDAFPQVDVIWRVWFGEYRFYSVRTDAKRILASKATDAGSVTNEDVLALSCCNKIKYLDVGHNFNLTDISFVSSMPELEVFIAATNEMLYDISPLADCPKLEYVELFTTSIMDLSPLANAKELRHLNISNCQQLSDISPLYGLTELERLWIGSITPIPAEQIQQMQAAAPDCTVNTSSSEPTEGAWRYISYDLNTGVSVWVPRYLQLMAQMGCNYSQFSFYWLDPKCDLAPPPHLAGKYSMPPEGEDADDYDPETYNADYYYSYHPEAANY